MVHIQTDACIGCGQCVRDCFEKNLVLKDGKAQVLGTCFACGHCIAVCPADACSIDDLPRDGIEAVGAPLDADALLSAIKSRRSIRHFLDKKVEREKIEKLIQAGRFTATGSNAQDVGYIVVQDTLEQVKPMIWEGLNAVATAFIEKGTPGLYAYRWQEMYRAHCADPTNKRDDLFFEAPLLLVLTGSETNCTLAAANIELMAQALGLGMLYSGFIRRGICFDPEAKAFLGLESDPSMCLLLGYPNVRYIRTVARKAPNVSWK